MIRPCTDADFPAILAIVNEAAQAYRGAIPADRWHEPYMSEASLRRELEAGVAFRGYEDGGELVGVMGLQQVRDATLVRHAYVRAARQRGGVGGALMRHLLQHTGGRVLVGTWAAATWAIAFYERHGFRLVGPAEKDQLLTTYWSIPARQRETSVVLVREAEPAGR